MAARQLRSRNKFPHCSYTPQHTSALLSNPRAGLAADGTPISCGSEEQIYSPPAPQLGACCQPTRTPGTRQGCGLLGLGWLSPTAGKERSCSVTAPSGLSRAQELQLASREGGEKCFSLFK